MIKIYSLNNKVLGSYLPNRILSLFSVIITLTESLFIFTEKPDLVYLRTYMNIPCIFSLRTILLEIELQKEREKGGGSVCIHACVCVLWTSANKDKYGFN